MLVYRALQITLLCSSTFSIDAITIYQSIYYKYIIIFILYNIFFIFYRNDLRASIRTSGIHASIRRSLSLLHDDEGVITIRSDGVGSGKVTGG